MKAALGSFLLVFVLASIPAVATTLYSNGPYDPTQNGWNIGTDLVSDSFTLSSGSTIIGFDFVTELYVPTFNSTGWLISSAVDGGAIYGGGTATNGAGLTQTYLAPSASIGWSWYEISVTGLDLSVGQGNYWLTLSTYDFGGYPVWWNENDGPSLAWDSTAGHNVGSEAFSIDGTQVPEPSSVVLILWAIFAASVICTGPCRSWLPSFRVEG